MVRPLPSLGLAAALAAVSSVAVADARTTVAVLEIGKGGAVRRTTAPSPHATVTGVASFWSAVHDEVNGRVRRGSQHPGMAVVPDLFSRPDGGLVLGVTGSAVDLADMPNLSSFLEKDAVGTFELAGSHGRALLKKAGNKAEDVLSNAADVASTIKTKAAAVGNKLESMAVTVENEQTATEIDSAIASAVHSLQKQSAKSGKTMILHLVIDEEESGAARRRLEDQQQDQDAEEEEADQEGDEADENEDENENDDNQNWNGNYNKQYSDASYGEKTIFQIQYFNVVLWTAIGLTIVLISAIYLMMHMPLMADTLLFGESAKVVGD